MKNRGFTIVEIMVAVIILGVIATIAVNVYSSVNESAKLQAHNNKISQIELAAEKWADEMNLQTAITVPVLQFVSDGYLSADDAETNSVIDPLDDSDIKCHDVNIVFENNVPVAKYVENENVDCEVSYTLDDDNGITILAYNLNDRSSDIGYSPITKELDWTNDDVLLFVTLDSDADFNVDDVEKITFSGGGINKSNSFDNVCDINETDFSSCSNTLEVTGENIVITIYITLETSVGIKTKDVIVKIDKVAPEIVLDYDNSEYVNRERTVDISATDGNVGSGVDTIEVTDSDSKYFSVNKASDGTASVTKHNGEYFVRVTDKAGNISEESFDISKVDTTYYTIKVLNVTGGTISTNLTKALFGTPIDVTATASKNYELQSLYYNSNLISNNTFEMPRENVNVVVNWKLLVVTKYRTRSSYWINGAATYSTFSPLYGWNCDDGNRCQNGPTFYTRDHPMCIGMPQPIYYCEIPGRWEYTGWTSWTTTKCSGSSTYCQSKICYANSPNGACYEVS